MFDRANPAHLVAVRARLSLERIGPYEAVVGGDPAHALRLYEWNTTVSAAFYGVLQSVEVILRNALHEQMERWHRTTGVRRTWLDDLGHVLDMRGRADIAEARRRIWHNGYPETPGRIVAELPFGFWRYLLAARYEQTLWTPALRHAFPHLRPQRRRDIADRVERLHRLRNRIAHHEPIHHRNLSLDHAHALAVIAAICPHTLAWAGGLSGVPATLSVRP